DVDIIVQGGVRDGEADTSFTVASADLERTLTILNRIQPNVGFKDVQSETGLVKVSIVGAGMVSNPGVAATMFTAISELGVSINTVSTSEIRISCIIASEKLVDVVRALHTAF